MEDILRIVELAFVFVGFLCGVSLFIGILFGEVSIGNMDGPKSIFWFIRSKDNADGR